MIEGERIGGARRRGRGGGGAARRAERTGPNLEFAKFIERKIPNFEILNEVLTSPLMPELSKNKS